MSTISLISIIINLLLGTGVLLTVVYPKYKSYKKQREHLERMRQVKVIREEVRKYLNELKS